MTHFVLDARTATPRYASVGRYVTNLARAIIPQLGPDERVTILFDPWHPLPISARAKAEVRPFLTSPFSIRQQWAMPAYLRHVNATLYHSPYYLMPYLPGVPTILTLYDLIPRLFPEHSSRRARFLFGRATALAMRAAQHLIVISEATKLDYLEHVGAPGERITVVPLAADPIFRPQPQDAVTAIRVKYRLPEHFVLYLGSNRPHKNLLRLVEAWHRVEVDGYTEGFTLVIAGVWNKRYPEVRQRAEALRLRNLLFLGPIGEPDMPALFSAASLFVFPSLYEGFGLPVLEAMACGVPVLCSNAASLPEIVGEAAWLVDPRDVDGLVDALAELLASPDQREAMSEIGLTQAARFSWAKTAAATLAVYREFTR